VPLADSIIWCQQIRHFARFWELYLSKGKIKGDLPERLDYLEAEIKRLGGPQAPSGRKRKKKRRR